jgi:hypothetical protein
MRGYLNRPDDTADTIIDGWLHTGDIGHLDHDGYLTLVGRSKEMIIRGGENIYPREIEDILTSDPAVVEAAVIGLPDETWGEVVAAFIQPRPGSIVDLDALKALCRERLSGFKRPTAIHVLEALPKNALGKVDKKSLRDVAPGGPQLGLLGRSVVAVAQAPDRASDIRPASKQGAKLGWETRACGAGSKLGREPPADVPMRICGHCWRRRNEIIASVPGSYSAPALRQWE